MARPASVMRLAALARRSCIALLAVAFWTPAGATAATTRVVLEPGLVAALTGEGELFVEAVPRRGEGLAAFARRLGGSEAAATAIVEANGGISRLLKGRRYRVPWRVVQAELQVRAARELFPADRAEIEGWRHRVADLGRGVGVPLVKVAEWFAPRPEAVRPLAESTGLPGEGPLPAGTEVLIPPELLRPAFRALLPPPPAGMTAFTLEYGSDATGPYAIYRLRPGEALYSAVVVRFTGRLHAEDVISLAGEIAARSGIPDVTDIAVGYPVKIPLDQLLPEFLPADDPRRREYEARLNESARFTNEVTARGLEGITVILDAGHGGADVGAMVGGAWESVYVYDVMLRVRAELERRTRATVVATTRDGEEFRIPDRDVLGLSRGHQVLTRPPYAIADASTGVHLRWYLANSVLRRAVNQIKGANEEKASETVVFISLHADSLLPSLRGATIYVPSAERTGGSFGKGGPVFSSRAEVRDQPKVAFTPRERTRSEGLSRQLASRIVGAFRDARLALHPFKPVRDTIIRNRRAWVPAVLRYNAVPAKILLEICNLANPEDRRLLMTREFRARIASAVVDGLLRYYGDEERAAASAVAAGEAQPGATQ